MVVRTFQLTPMQSHFCFLSCRSATLVLAYLMKYKRMRLVDAHALVKSKRPLIRPNMGFWAALVDYEKKLFHENTIVMVQASVGKVPTCSPKKISCNCTDSLCLIV